MEKMSRMSYKETVEIINKIMKNETEMKKAFGKYDDITKTVSLVSQHIDAANQEKSVYMSEEDKKLVNGLINRLLQHVIVNEHPKIFRDLVFHLMKLLGNWNNNIYKNKDVELKLKSIDRMMRDAQTFNDAEYALKMLIGISKDLIKYKPPMFDVSRHYLETLKEEITKS